MIMTDFIAKNANINPEKTAFIEVGPISGYRKIIQWNELQSRIDRLSNALLEMGIGKGDRILILGRNSIRWLEAYFAILGTGALAVPLNYRFSDENILFCTNVSEAKVFFMDVEYLTRMIALRSELTTVRHFIVIGAGKTGDMENMEELIRITSPRKHHIDIGDDAECALYFTSGTTGKPKPVLLMHKNIVCSGLCEVVNERWEHTDTLLMLPPFYHLAIGHLFGCIIAGGTAVLLTEKITPEIIFDCISRERVTLVFLLVPWVLDIIEAMDEKKLNMNDYDLDQWRLLFMGAQPIPSDLIMRWKNYFPGMEYNINYGLSEAGGPGAIQVGIGNDEKYDTIGKPALLWDARIVNEIGKDVKQGETGEIILRGPGIMKEYYNNPELTAATIKNGWLYTGDLGRKDVDGFIYLVDRKKDVIIRGGENIFPVEIEEVIQSHPSVHDVAVIGIPDERLGEAVAAIIEALPDHDLNVDDMILFCEQKLPRYKRPSQIIFDKVPRSTTGKLEKPKLRDKYCRQGLY